MEVEQGIFNLEDGSMIFESLPAEEGKKTFRSQALAFLATKFAEKGIQTNYIWLKRERRKPALAFGDRILQVSTTTLRYEERARPVILCPNAENTRQKPYHVRIGAKLIYNDITDFAIAVVRPEDKFILLRYPDVSVELRKQLLERVELYIVGRNLVVEFFRGHPRTRSIHENVWRKERYSLDCWIGRHRKEINGEQDKEGF